MEKIATVLSFVTVLILNYSCSKSDIEKGIDGVAESIYQKVTHTADASNPKKINFSVEYTGTKTL